MAMQSLVSLNTYGLDTSTLGYVSLANVRLTQRRENNTGRVFWYVSATVNVHASRDAKYADKPPFETSHIEGEYNPDGGSPMAALYDALKKVARFEGAQDV